MATLLIVTYNIDDADTYAKYNPGSLETIGKTIAKHGGEILAADPSSEFMAGDKRDVVVVLKFPDADAAKAWHDDPEYAAAKEIRLSSTSNITAMLVTTLG